MLEISLHYLTILFWYFTVSRAYPGSGVCNTSLLLAIQFCQWIEIN